jgi:hypothetical protein
MEARVTERRWRCSRCGTLLGIARGEEMEMKYRDAHYVAQGPVKAICRRCGAACRSDDDPALQGIVPRRP